MNSNNNTVQISKNGAGSVSATPSLDVLNRRLGVSLAPRMLTPYEIDLLRQSKMEMAQAVSEYLASKENKLQSWNSA